MSNEERIFNTRFEVRAADDEERIIEGMAAPYGRWSPIGNLYLERFAVNAFKRSTDRHGTSIALLWQHDADEFPIGKPLEWRHTPDGVFGVWKIAGHKRGDEVYQMARDGFLKGMSVGFTPVRDDTDVSGEVPRVTRVEARLGEVSVVTVPAYEDAQVTRVRTQGIRVGTPNLAAWRQTLDSLLA